MCSKQEAVECPSIAIYPVCFRPHPVGINTKTTATLSMNTGWMHSLYLAMLPFLVY